MPDSPIAISGATFAFVFGGALLGMLIQKILPPEHLNATSKDIIKGCVGLIGTTVALVLGLLIASAKGFYDAQNTELIRASANVVLLDKTLLHYGPGANQSRDILRNLIAQLVDTKRRPNMSRTSYVQPAAQMGSQVLVESIEALSPHDDFQRGMKSEALSLVISLGQTRWLMFEQRTTPLPIALIVVLVCWLVVIFMSFGLMAPPNGTVIVSLCMASLAVSCAVLLILELDSPYRGLIQISDAPLRAALASLGQ